MTFIHVELIYSTLATCSFDAVKKVDYWLPMKYFKRSIRIEFNTKHVALTFLLVVGFMPHSDLR